jgi:hypothetical protein
VRRHAAVRHANDAVLATIDFTQIHGTPTSVQDRSPQDFLHIMRREANISQRAVVEPQQFILLAT